MPDLLLELFSEEIPARMQSRAASDLERLMAEALTAAGLSPSATRTVSGPRRLALIAEGLPAQSAATIEERKGPRVGTPEKAIAGFLRGAGLASLAECETVADPKGDYYVARLEKPGRAAADIIAQAVPDIVQRFPWPKSMRWGAGRLRWVRPLHAILCLLDGEIVPFAVDGVPSGNVTYGHRFMSGARATEPAAIVINSNQSYADALLHAKVVASRDVRAEKILADAKRIAADASLDLVEDHGLLDENAGLVEWPVVYSGTFEESFLDVPPEILMTAMKAHQKCFSLRNQKTGALANRFILVSNLEAEDGGKAIVRGNERVIRARLADAKFFWRNDTSRPLDDLVQRLGQVTFHEKLGTQLRRVERIKALAREIAPLVGADPAKAEEAAHLAKADLMSETVGEFPELQGIIGRYIALAQGRDPEVADAIAEHYRPQGPSDAVPSSPVAVAVALADKLDMLVGFWAINEKPTGSKDPYALRRAALGVIRIVLENELRLPLFKLLRDHAIRFTEFADDQNFERVTKPLFDLPAQVRELEQFKQIVAKFAFEPLILSSYSKSFREGVSYADNLLTFFADRLKVYLREKGARHDLIDAVFALPGQDDLLMIVQRVELLGRFLENDDGANLLAGIKRAQNILRIEEKNDAAAYDGKPAAKLLKDPHEKTLHKAIAEVRRQVEAALAAEDFERAMAALAKLRAPVDTFFEHVTVNADDPALRENRLKLLGQIRALALDIADFSKIEG